MQPNKTIRKNKYLFFFIRAICLCFIIFLLDFLIGNVLRYFYFNQKSGRQYRAYYTIEKTNADVLIFGSSRAYNHYRPDIVENRLKLSCYNSGSPGQFLLYNYATLRAVLKRYSPKFIILELMPDCLSVEEATQNSYDRLSFLLPYYRDHEEMQSVIDLRGKYEKYKLFSSIYPFNSSIIYTIAGYLNPKKFQELNTAYKGYQPAFEIWNKPMEPPSYLGSDLLDSNKVNAYKNFISECKEAGSRLFIVCSPMYSIYTEETKSLEVSKKIAKEQNVKFIDFTNDTSFIQHPELFAYDPNHLNHDGAGIFTNRLIDSIVNSGKELLIEQLKE